MTSSNRKSVSGQGARWAMSASLLAIALGAAQGAQAQARDCTDGDPPVGSQDGDGNAHQGDVIAIDCRNTYAYNFFQYRQQHSI